MAPLEKPNRLRQAGIVSANVLSWLPIARPLGGIFSAISKEAYHEGFREWFSYFWGVAAGGLVLSLTAMSSYGFSQGDKASGIIIGAASTVGWLIGYVQALEDGKVWLPKRERLAQEAKRRDAMTTATSSGQITGIRSPRRISL